MQAKTGLVPAELPDRDLYAFQNAEEKILFNKITQELRCSVCQNQTLADSSAPLANDLRQVIYKQILKKHSEQEIMGYVMERYGEFVLYRPLFTPSTLILWLGPLIMLVLGMVILGRTFKSFKNGQSTKSHPIMSQFIMDNDHCPGGVEKQ